MKNTTPSIGLSGLKGLAITEKKQENMAGNGTRIILGIRAMLWREIVVQILQESHIYIMAQKVSVLNSLRKWLKKYGGEIKDGHLKDHQSTGSTQKEITNRTIADSLSFRKTVEGQIIVIAGEDPIALKRMKIQEMVLMSEALNQNKTKN